MTSDLIARLEKATEGSRELDDEIFLLVNDGVRPMIGDYRGHTIPADAPHYTTSIDAKLPWENIAHVHAPDWHCAKPPGRWQAAHDCGEGRAVYGYGRTEALARRIAALRARETPHDH